MNISVIIPNWNGRKLLEKNLPLVIKNSGTAEIIVVDDASPDDSLNFLKDNYPQIVSIKHGKNLGFGESCNDGVKAAHGEIIILLNLDVVPEPNYIPPALELFDNSQTFAVSFNEINNSQFSYSVGCFKDGFITHEPRPKTNKVQESFWASGGSAAFRKSMWQQLGGFDRILNPFYWEDIDLSYRAQKRGWKVYWHPGAKVRHEHQGTIGQLNKNYVDRIRERNQLLVIWKNITDQGLMKQHHQGLFSRLRHPGYLRILLSALPFLSEAHQKNIIEQKQQVVSDCEILHII